MKIHKATQGIHLFRDLTANTTDAVMHQKDQLLTGRKFSIHRLTVKLIKVLARKMKLK
jgi:hypothetical protein